MTSYLHLGRGCALTLLSKLEFGSLLAYTARPVTLEQHRAKTMMRRLKDDLASGDPPQPFSATVAQYVLNNLATLPFHDFFGKLVTLIPVPSSSLKERGSLHVPLNLAMELERRGLGAVLDCLKRTEALPKAALAQPGHRPKAHDHGRTMRVEASLNVTNDIVLVDDVVTTGAASLGAAQLLHAIYPRATIRAFAALRTIREPKDFTERLAPCRGLITLDPYGNSTRTP